MLHYDGLPIPTKERLLKTGTSHILLEAAGEAAVMYAGNRTENTRVPNATGSTHSARLG